jgi:hypothetical protein
MHLIRLTSLASILLLSQAVLAHEGPKGYASSQAVSFSALASEILAHPTLHTRPEGRAYRASYSALFGTETSHPIPNAPVGHRQPSMADVAGSKPMGPANVTERVRSPRAGRVYRDTDDGNTPRICTNCDV